MYVFLSFRRIGSFYACEVLRREAMLWLLTGWKSMARQCAEEICEATEADNISWATKCLNFTLSDYMG